MPLSDSQVHQGDEHEHFRKWILFKARFFEDGVRGRVGRSGQAAPAGGLFVRVTDLAPAAQERWQAYWRECNPAGRPLPRGRAHDIEKEFVRLTGTTPIDLDDKAFDFQFYPAACHRVDQLIDGR